MDKKTNRPAVLILAAGHSERMGFPKHQLMFSDEESFLDHIIKVYKRFVVSDIVVVINDTSKVKGDGFLDPVKVVINNNPEYGRFHSIQLGLKKLETKNVFIQNIDNPFVNPGLFINLQNGLQEADFSVPVFDEKGGHPVFLSMKIVNSIINDFKKEDRLNEVLKSFNRKDILVNDPYVLVNINTPEDYRKFFTGIKESRFTLK